MMFRGVRGATTVNDNTPEEIVSAAQELLQAMVEANGMEEEYVASVIFTTTPDLTAAYPAAAARQMGWTQTALMGCQEMNVPGSLPKCLRVLVHWNTQKQINEIIHVYLRGAQVLRPDITLKNKAVLNGSEVQQ